MFVKICANTTAADAQLALMHGADAIGFVFAASKRQITPLQAGEINAALTSGGERVGVFSSTDAATIVGDAETAHLTIAQLHSRYDPQLTAALHRMRPSLRLIQVFSLQPDQDQAELTSTLRAVWQDPAVYAVLLDAAHGGSGTSFDWTRLVPAVHEARTSPQQRLIVAGGLHSGNVAQAVELFEPWGVDVASGVEASPGLKDPVRLREFIAAANAAAARNQDGSLS